MNVKFRMLIILVREDEIMEESQPLYVYILVFFTAYILIICCIYYFIYEISSSKNFQGKNILSSIIL